MLKLMRDSFQQLKWILVAIVAIFILFIFVDWGAGGARGRTDDRAYAARVNGETISYQDYNRALYFAEENYKRMYGGQWTPEMAEAMGLNRQVLDSLIDQRLLLQEAARLHLDATSEEVRKKILSMPALNPDGHFIGPELYARFVTVQLGYATPAEFEDDLARQITLDKIESALANSIVVSPKAAEAEYRLANESAKIRYLLYPASHAVATVNTTPAEVDQYYRANQDKYTHAEQRDLRYLVADLARIRSQIVPSEQDLRKRYDTSREDFRQPESAHVLHILIKADASATPQQNAAAKAKAETLVAQLRAGSDFAKLAKKNSQDPSSAGSGGDMGWVEQGRTVEPFDRAIFSLPLNQISDPIYSQEYGYHIVKVLERRSGGYKSFEEVRAQLSSQIANQMAKDQAREEIMRVAARLKEKNPKTADEFASYANDKVTSNATQWFQKTEQIPGLGFNQPLSSWAFAAKQGDISDVIGTSRGPAIAYVVAVRPPGVTAMAEIRAKVENDERMAKAREAARQTVAGATAGATSVDAVASKLGLTAAETTVTRRGFVSGIPGDTSALVESAISSKVGELKGPVVIGDSAVVFQPLEQKKTDQTELTKNRAAYVDAVRQREARSLRTSLLQRLRKDARIDVNRKLLEQTRGTESRA